MRKTTAPSPKRLALKPEERLLLLASPRCKDCGHLDELHTRHCCYCCNVDGCTCEDIYR